MDLHCCDFLTLSTVHLFQTFDLSRADWPYLTFLRVQKFHYQHTYSPSHLCLELWVWRRRSRRGKNAAFVWNAEKIPGLVSPHRSQASLA